MRVGVAGAGRIGEVHVRTLRRHPEVSDICLYEPDPERARGLSGVPGVALAPSVGAMLSEVDAVLVASPTPTHAELVEAGIAGGIPVFCEKPVAEDLEQLLRLAGLAERSGARVQVGFHYRFDPALRGLATSVSVAGPRFVRVHSTTGFAPSPEYLAGAGGLMADKLIHELDMVRWLTGSAVTALVALGEGADEPMTAGLLLQLADGGLAAVWGAYRSAAGFDLTVEVETAEAVHVVGNRRPGGDGPARVQPSAVVDFRDRFAAAYEAEVHAFLDFASGNGPNPCSLEEAVQTQLVVSAAQSALRDGGRVAVGKHR